MSLSEMKEYLDLCLQGQDTIPARQKILDIKLNELEHKIIEIKESIDYIHWKQGFYKDVLSGKTKYFSNLIQTEDDD